MSSLALALLACATEPPPLPPVVGPPPPLIELAITASNDADTGFTTLQVTGHTDFAPATEFEARVDCGRVRRLSDNGYRKGTVGEDGDFTIKFGGGPQPGTPVTISPFVEAGDTCHLLLVSREGTLADVVLDARLLVEGQPPRVQLYKSTAP